MKLKRTPNVEVILPVYNEVDNIQPLLERMDAVIASMEGEARFTFLFVNDGSKDGSAELLTRLNSQRTDIRVIHLIHNFGHGAALACGLEQFSADIALFMDCDLQDSPEAIPKMYEKWKQGAKTVVAARGDRAEAAGVLFKIFYYLLHRVSRKLPPVSFGTFCLLDASVVERMRKLPERDRYFPGLVAFASSQIHAVPVYREARHQGSSRVGSWGLINLAITAFLSFSNTPIRLVSIVGLVSSGSAILSGLTIVGIKLFTDRAIPGWASTLSAIFFSTGMQLLCLGIIGEYIGRIFEEVKRRPVYLIDRELPIQEGERKKKISA